MNIHAELVFAQQLDAELLLAIVSYFMDLVLDPDVIGRFEYAE